MKRIISYNVNGIRAAIKKGLFDWIKKNNPDILCIQETKAQCGQMHENVFNELGYKVYEHSAIKKGYSGVAIFSKQEPEKIVKGIGIKKYDQEGRVIRADFEEISVISVYIPSGTTGDLRQNLKMEFLEDLRKYINQLRSKRKKIIISGDFNICRLWIDIHNPENQLNTSGFLPEEREWFRRFIDEGYIDSFRDFNQNPHQYSWWSYRAGARNNNKGWRIDYNIVTNELKNNMINAAIDTDAIYSDHCPVILDIEF